MRAVVAASMLAASAAATNENMTPVGRVVVLLEGLQAQAKEEQKSEEKQFMKFKCYAESTKKKLLAQNEDLQGEIDALQTFIDNTDAGRNEFTPERKELTAALAKSNAELQDATNDEAERKAAADAAIAEQGATVTALKAAVTALTEGTGDRKTLLQSGEGASTEFLARKAENFDNAVSMARAVLSKDDFRFFEQKILGLVQQNPNGTGKDWGKLDKKGKFATEIDFKREDGILTFLGGLESKFLGEKEAAEAANRAAVNAFTKLEKDLKAEQAALQKKITAAAGEKAEKAKKLAAARKSKTAKVAQIKTNNDLLFGDDEIEGEKGGLMLEAKNNKDNYMAKRTIRVAEIAAIYKAIQVLTSGDNKAIFKKSFASQNSFLQVGETRSMTVTNVSADDETIQGQMGKLATMVNNMIIKLNDEQKVDDKSRQEAIESTTEFAKKGRAGANEVQVAQLAIEVLEGKIAAHQTEKRKQRNIELENQEALYEAKKLRFDQNALHTVNVRDDNDAINAINEARDIIKGFQADHKVFLQEKPVAVSGGDTFEGKQEEHMGVMAIMKMITEDIQRDIDVANQAEAAQLTAFTTQETAFTNAITEAVTAAKAEQTSINTAQTEIATQVNARKIGEGVVNNEVSSYNKEKEMFDFYIHNHAEAKTHRTAEIDGLEGAQKVLKMLTDQYEAKDAARIKAEGDRAAEAKTQADATKAIAAKNEAAKIAAAEKAAAAKLAAQADKGADKIKKAAGGGP